MAQNVGEMQKILVTFAWFWPIATPGNKHIHQAPSSAGD